jgi:hypothetical protein
MAASTDFRSLSVRHDGGLRSWQRIICLLLLLLLVPVCGVHIAGAHHDSHADSLGVAEARQATKHTPEIRAIPASIVSFHLIPVGATHSIGSLYAATGSPHSSPTLHPPLRR